MAVEVKDRLMNTGEPRRFAGEDRDTVTIRVRKTMGPEFRLDLAFSAVPGITILFGGSGAGKTTLLNCVAGLTTPEQGRIAFGELVMFDSENAIDVPICKRQTGYVFQNLALFPHLTVEQNIRYGLLSRPADESKKQCREILESFRIGHLAERKPNAISGGERQRVALARSLVTSPHMLLLDEPLAALDAATKAKIVEDLRAWNEKHGIPILYVTHSREEVFALGERVVVLDGGKIIAGQKGHMHLKSFNLCCQVLNVGRSVVDFKAGALPFIGERVLRCMRGSVSGHYFQYIRSIRQKTGFKRIELLRDAGFQQFPVALIFTAIIN